SLVEWSREHHADKTADESKIPEIMSFVRWAAAEAAYPPGVAPLVEALLDGVRDALGDNFTGLYLCGSLALGGFGPETSDADMLVVTERPVSDAEFTALKALHERLPPEGNDFSLDYDIYYIDRETIRRFAEGQRHVKVGAGEPFHRGEHRPNWVLERWTVRERGVVVSGPDPKTLIEPISADDLRAAAGEELQRRLAHWRDGSWPREELAVVGAQAFEVETVCRALFTMEAGAVSTKREAVDWAIAALPERWQMLIEWGRGCGRGPARDETKVPEVLEFLTWAAGKTG
ncbi:MAG TPA: aminoglycoside adenylyltransferase domain-containing protein, partial [Dehalococcoidia bacterium]